MGKFDGILIISDVDGTYYGLDHRRIPGNDEAVRYFQSEGGLFTFATGRMERNMATAVPNVAELVNFPVLLNNGSTLYDFRTREILRSCFMESETVAPVVAYALEMFPNVGIRATVPGGFLYPRDHPLLSRDLGYLADCSWKKPLSEWDFSRINKVVFRGAAKDLLVMQKAIIDRFSDRLATILSEAEILEVQRKDVNKGSAINLLRQELFESYGVKWIFCIGDYENDLEMLCAADFAACPQNAIDSVKEVASIHLCDCKDGAVADLINYIEAHPELCSPSSL